MNIAITPLKDVLLLTPNVFNDERGYFFESFNQQKVAKFIKCDFVQDNESLSQKNVLRGLHFQIPPYAQDKLVRVIKGSALDVIVDLRKSSPTYGQHFSAVLSGDNKKQLFIPAGFAHGFVTLEDGTIFNYKCSNYYEKSAERTILWNDLSLNIAWNCDQPILSDKDLIGETFSNFDSPFN